MINLDSHSKTYTGCDTQKPRLVVMRISDDLLIELQLQKCGKARFKITKRQ